MANDVGAASTPHRKASFKLVRWGLVGGLVAVALLLAYLQGRTAAPAAQPAGADAVVQVDCNAGGTVTAALANLPASQPGGTIVVDGHCAESVVIQRDGVTLRGKDDDAEIDGDIAVLVTNGASGVRLESIRLKGRFAGLTCSYGSSVDARDLTIYGGARGLSAFYGGICALENSMISRNIQGVTVGDSGSVRMNGSIVEHSVVGINIFTNGTLTLDKSGDYARSIVRKNQTGIEISTSGSLRPVAATIEGNRGDGLVIHAGGAVYADEDYLVELKDNQRDGIRVRTGGILQLARGFSFENNGGQGLECAPGAQVETKTQGGAPAEDMTTGAKGRCAGG